MVYDENKNGIQGSKIVGGLLGGGLGFLAANMLAAPGSGILGTVAMIALPLVGAGFAAQFADTLSTKVIAANTPKGDAKTQQASGKNHKGHEEEKATTEIPAEPTVDFKTLQNAVARKPQETSFTPGDLLPSPATPARTQDINAKQTATNLS